MEEVAHFVAEVRPQERREGLSPSRRSRPGGRSRANGGFRGRPSPGAVGGWSAKETEGAAWKHRSIQACLGFFLEIFLASLPGRKRCERTSCPFLQSLSGPLRLRPSASLVCALPSRPRRASPPSQTECRRPPQGLTGAQPDTSLRCQVVDQVVDFEMSEAEKDLHSRAEGLLGQGPRDKTAQGSSVTCRLVRL